MSNKSSFESKVLDFWTNAPFVKVEIVHGLVREIFKRRKADAADEAKRVSQITSTPAQPKVRRKRRTKAEMAAARAVSEVKHGDVGESKNDIALRI